VLHSSAVQIERDGDNQASSASSSDAGTGSNGAARRRCPWPPQRFSVQNGLAVVTRGTGANSAPVAHLVRTAGDATSRFWKILLSLQR
jgi:hypothetical protein